MCERQRQAFADRMKRHLEGSATPRFKDPVRARAPLEHERSLAEQRHRLPKLQSDSVASLPSQRTQSFASLGGLGSMREDSDGDIGKGERVGEAGSVRARKGKLFPGKLNPSQSDDPIFLLIEDPDGTRPYRRATSCCSCRRRRRQGVRGGDCQQARRRIEVIDDAEAGRILDPGRRCRSRGSGAAAASSRPLSAVVAWCLLLHIRSTTRLERRSRCGRRRGRWCVLSVVANFFERFHRHFLLVRHTILIGTG